MSAPGSIHAQRNEPEVVISTAPSIHSQLDRTDAQSKDGIVGLKPKPTYKSTGIEPKPFNHSRSVSNHSNDLLDQYFVGPRNLDKHSKWPYFMRLHGSVLPKMIIPLLFVGVWATLITCLSKFVYNLGISSLLLTVLGFVVGLSLSFRSSTAYERYAEGRRYWGLLSLTSRNLARVIWVHIPESEGDLAKQDLLGKLTALNLILAFAVALKHKLRFEPFAHYEDLSCLVDHLDTYAKAAHSHAPPQQKKSAWKEAGEYLGIPFARSNPRKDMKRAKKPMGNLPLEILTHLSAYVETKFTDGGLKVSIVQTQVLNSLATLMEIQTNTERVLNTPLPEAYSILISQITWIYVLALPFQLYTSLQWVTIPGCILAAYIILGIAAIGQEIENPFGQDVNDLPLDQYCRELADEIDIITATPAPKPAEFMAKNENLVIQGLSSSGYSSWSQRSIQDIRDALRARPLVTKHGMMAPTSSKGAEKVEA